MGPKTKFLGETPSTRVNIVGFFWPTYMSKLLLKKTFVQSFKNVCKKFRPLDRGFMYNVLKNH